MNYQKLLEEKLREAACLGNVDVLKELILKGVDINSKNGVNGWTALHWAACRGNTEAVSLLLANGANPMSLTSQKDLPCNLTTNEEIQVLLGAKTLNKKRSSLPIVPNYLRNPPLCLSAFESSEKTDSIENNIHSDKALVLKLRIAESSESDFIEIELPKSDCSFEELKEVCCKELNIDPKTVLRIRKLPNTIIRNKNDVLRLTDLQELEIVKSKTVF